MRTTITARHCEISDELRQRAEAVLARLASQISRPLDGTVIFDQAPPPVGTTVEIRIKASRGEPIVASGEDKDHRSALDRAEEKVRRQLERSAPERRGRSAKDTV